MDNVINYLPLIDLIPGEFHPHLEFSNDNLDNLINSIKNYGILEPLLVRKKNDKYEIILGNRRYNAAKKLGIEKVPVIILNIDDSTALNMIISDNVQRKELSSKEEAKLYDKALSFPNINKEILSKNLGIPLDRIISKLELLKKDKNNNKEPVEIQKQEDNYLKENNSINNDIINLKDLNKEYERDELYMNNNQLNTNNISEQILNNNLNQENSNEPTNSQPTFGGRFFPSLEDEPTNMNLSSSNPIMSNNNTESFNNNQNISPLIDLTDTTPTAQNTNVDQVQTPSVPSFDINQNTQEPNIDFNNNIMPNNQEIPTENKFINLDLNTTTPQPAPAPMPNIELPDSLNIPNITEQNQEQNIEIPNLYNTSNIPNIENQPQQINNINSINDMNNISMPEISNTDTMMPQNNINNDIPVPPNNLNTTELPASDIINNIPTPQTESINDSKNNDISLIPNIEQAPNTPTKDIIPVVNMIKNLAIGIKSLGYKLTITEDETNESYKLNIEVEK